MLPQRAQDKWGRTEFGNQETRKGIVNQEKRNAEKISEFRLADK